MAVIVVVFVVTMAVVFMIVEAAIVADFVLAVPVVVMVDMAAGAVPVACVEATTLVARSNPAGATVGRTSPIAFMPPIVTGNGVPVTFDPEKVRVGLCGHNNYSARRRWRADLNADGNLCFGWNAGQKECGKSGRFQQSLNHDSLLELKWCFAHFPP